MTSDDDFIGRLEDYLESFEGTTPLPDRVRDAVRAELPWTRQVNPRLGLRRTDMSSTTTLFRWGLLAAALVVIVLAGSILLSGGSRGVTQPSAPPTPIPQAVIGASEVPCASAAPSSSTCLPAGTYQLGTAVPGGLIDIPAGWFQWAVGGGAAGVLAEDSDVPNSSGWGIVFMQVGEVSRDPCNPSAGTYPAAEVDSPEKLASVMTTWPGFHGTPPATIEVGGVAGIRTQLTWTGDAAACPTAMIWRTPSETAIDAYPMIAAGTPDYPADFRLIKLAGGVVAIRSMASARTSPFERQQGVPDDPTRHTQDLVAMQGILDSIRFDGGGS